MGTSVKVVGPGGGGSGAKKVIVITGTCKADQLQTFKPVHRRKKTSKPQSSCPGIGILAVQQHQQHQQCYVAVGKVVAKRGGLTYADME